MSSPAFGLFTRGTNKAKLSSCPTRLVAPTLAIHALPPCVLYQRVICFAISKSAITADVAQAVIGRNRPSCLLVPFGRVTARLSLFSTTSLRGVLLHLLFYGSFQFLAFSSVFSLLFLSVLLYCSLPSLL